MVVGVLTLDLFFPHARSLKDKRRILHGFKDRLHRHNVAVAELDHQDLWQRTRLGRRHRPRPPGRRRGDPRPGPGRRPEPRRGRDRRPGDPLCLRRASGRGASPSSSRPSSAASSSPSSRTPASGLLTVTRVEMTPDLLTARVFLERLRAGRPGGPPRTPRAGQGLHPPDRLPPASS
ncbi:MAG: DUF503 family protein [Candidatus Moduliflexus flocculans]|nr:DUF503 family protein [Candidatus Moduliflexus flocculans]